MTAAKTRARKTAPVPDAPEDRARRLSTADLVLLRIAASPATRAELQRDLLPVVSEGRAGTTFRQAAELAIGSFASRSLITDARGRLQATAMGRSKAANLVPGFGAVESWEQAQLTLLACALGLPHSPSPALKAIQRHYGLAALVLQRHFRLPTDRARSLNDLRSALAVVALERAFGDRIKTGLGKGAGLPSKAARILAGQLLTAPREFSSDGKLIAALAADVAGARDTTFDALRLAVLRRLTSEAPVRSNDPEPVTRYGPQRAPDNDALPAQSVASPAVHAKPDMAEFAGAVLDAARPVAQGWPGSRKAFISLVWQAIRNARPGWGLSETAFKSMLSEAHRTGAVVLASADLKDRCDLKELEDSKILYKNTVWHFVRVED